MGLFKSMGMRRGLSWSCERRDFGMRLLELSDIGGERDG